MLNVSLVYLDKEGTMTDENFSRFERVSQKMGWDGEGGLDTAEKKVRCTCISHKLIQKDE